MADSDEEYNDRRKGRDKFRRERNDYERRDDRRRDPRQWDHDRSNGRSSWGSQRDRRDPYREYDSHRRDRGYSPGGRRDMSPPNAKRMRRDTWEEGSGGFPPYGYNGPPSGGGGSGPPPGGMDPDGGHGPGPNRDEMQTQPAMMTFKAFLQTLPDNISDQDAIKKFNEYKMDFKKQQINEFFLQHKEEEWFKTKYHPEECAKRKEEVRKALKNRCEVFMEFMKAGRVASVACDIERNEELVKLLDAVVIKLEGGNDFDLTVLDQPEPEEQGTRSRNNSESVTMDQSPDQKKKRKREEAEKKPDEPLKLPITAEQKELMKKAQEFSKQQQAKNGGQDGKKSKKKKRNRDKTEYSYESGSDSESESGSESDEEPAPPGMEDEPPPPGTEASEDSNIPGVSSTDDITDKPKEEGQITEEKDVDTTQEDDTPKPRALHKTCSIFLRNLAPSITKQEVEAMCKRYPGFVRVALQDPQPERRFFRRGWVTFSREVNIKEICWNLNNIRLRDCELGATLNRELKQRIRPINGITAYKQIVKADIKMAAKIMQNLDQKWRIWEEDGDEEKKDDEKEKPVAFESVMKNPILKNVTDFLIDEGDFEEEELLGQSSKDGEGDPKTDEIKMERDESMIKALDSMVLYLRIVYSIDFYSCNEYPNEDEMPHRCGIMHARCVPPTTKVTQNDINEWIKNFENKIKTLTEHHENLPDEEVAKLGRKDPEHEVEKFVTANTQELAKDKWLCPISGKKFKGPEFVRKHIFNKHGEKVEEVKMEVSFFNNYLMDPRRPALPEHPGNKPSSSNRNSSGGGDQFTGPSGFQGMPHMGYSGGRPPMMYGGSGGGGMHPGSYHSPSYRNRESYRGRYGRSNYGYRSDPRRVIEYRDLDAPDDSDIF